MERWAAHIKAFLSDGLDVYAYFNNDALGDAVPNAQMLGKMASNTEAGRQPLARRDVSTSRRGSGTGKGVGKRG